MPNPEQGAPERIVGYRFKFDNEKEWAITTRLEYVPLALQGDSVEIDPDMRGVCEPLVLATRVEELEAWKVVSKAELDARNERVEELERALGELEPLVREVMDSHQDIESADYNECEITECEWCFGSRTALTQAQGEGS